MTHRTLRTISLAALCGWLAFGIGPVHAASFGIDIQDNYHLGNPNPPYLLGPYSVADETPATAFGVPAANWIEPGVLAHLPSTAYGLPSFNGASVNVQYTGYFLYGYTSLGFTHINTPGVPPLTGDPLSGEEAVLSGSIFSIGEGEYEGLEHEPVIFTISGLSNIASSYSVKAVASMAWTAERYTPAVVTDNAAVPKTGVVNFNSNPDVPGAAEPDVHATWYSAVFNTDLDNDGVAESDGLLSTGSINVATADGTGTTPVLFTGDSITIVIDNWNEYTDDDGYLTRSALAGVIIEYTPITSPNVPGDFDSDGDVDGADFVVWQTNFPTATGAMLDDGDADGDGDVDGADFVVWQTNFPTTPGPGVATVPESTSFMLLAIGGLMVMGRRSLRMLNRR